MSGLTPDQVIEFKHTMAGVAELTHDFYTALCNEGFLHQDALQLTQAWMTALVTMKHEDSA